MKLAFLVGKGLLCLCNTWLLVNMEFLLEFSTQHLTHLLPSLVSYRVEHSKRNSLIIYAHPCIILYIFHT